MKLRRLNGASVVRTFTNFFNARWMKRYYKEKGG